MVHQWLFNKMTSYKNTIVPPPKDIYYALIFIYNIFNSNIKSALHFFNIKVEQSCPFTGLKVFKRNIKVYNISMISLHNVLIYFIRTELRDMYVL